MCRISEVKEMTTTIYIPMAPNKKVEKLLNKKRDVEMELKRIRDNCKHPEKVLRMIPNPPGGYTRWVCIECDSEVGYPTNEEIKKFLSN